MLSASPPKKSTGIWKIHLCVWLEFIFMLSAKIVLSDPSASVCVSNTNALHSSSKLYQMLNRKSRCSPIREKKKLQRKRKLRTGQGIIVTRSLL